MFCKKCGAQLNEQAKFCIICGEPVQSEADVIPVTQEVPVTPVAQSIPTAQEVPVTPVVQPVPTSQEAPVIPVVPEVSDKKRKKEQKKAEKKVYRDAVLHPVQMKAFPSVLLSVIFGIFIFVLTLFVSLSLTIQHTVKGSALFDTVNQKNLSDIPVSQMISQEQAAVLGVSEEIDEDTTIYDVISDMIGEESFTPQAIENIMNNSSIQSYLALTVNQYGQFLTGDGTSDKVSAKDVAEIVEKNKDVIYEYTGYEITEENISKLEKTLDENKELLAVFNPSKILDNNSGIEMVSVFMSPVITVVLFVMITVFIILLALFTRRLRFTFVTSAVCFISSGVIFFAIPVLLPVFVKNEFLCHTGLQAIADARITCGSVLMIAGLSLLLIQALMKLFGGHAKEAVINENK